MARGTVGKTNNPDGRPSKFSADLQARICEDVKGGVPITKAFSSNGIAISTGYKWREELPDFSAAVDKAEAEWEATALKKLNYQDDWKAQATLLKMRRPEYRDGHKVDIKVNAEANATSSAVSQEKLEQIQRLRRVVTLGGLGTQ